MRFLALFLLVALLGCDTERVRQERLQLEADVQSLVGEKIESISGIEKPITIRTSGGKTLILNCSKYSMQVEVVK